MIKSKLLKTMDFFIRFMALLGAPVLAFVGIILGWWDGNTGAVIYAVIFFAGWGYCLEYNDREF